MSVLDPVILSSSLTNTETDYDPDLCQDHCQGNYALPVSDWDGLLAVELSLRKDSNNTALDLTTCLGRSTLLNYTGSPEERAQLIRSKEFLESKRNN